MTRRAEPLSRLFCFRYRAPGGRAWTVVKNRSLALAKEHQRRCITWGWDVEPIRVPEVPNE